MRLAAADRQLVSPLSLPPEVILDESGQLQCTACHDPRGISMIVTLGSDHTHLINFDTTIVRPDPTTLRLGFRDLGRFAGSCTLTCHGAIHTDLTYGILGEAMP